ncbi:MAG: methyltransferase domain-containing protein [Acidobacteria bacterium]|nr:methyltransferase domain-containing protein [Acidobacteriota bacterium]
MTVGFKSVQRVQFLKELAKGKRVLHLGCTNFPYTLDSIAAGSLLHADLAAIADELTGFDFDQEGIDLLTERGFGELYRADLERLEEVTLEREFDVIIAGEMIEHLNNPGLFLKGIQRFMNSETKLAITTVNAFCAFRFVIYGFRGKGGQNEPVHPDHVAYYSYRTLKKLIDNSGLTIDEFNFYDLGVEHRGTLKWYYRAVNDVSVALFPQLSDGVIAVCRKRTEGAE